MFLKNEKLLLEADRGPVKQLLDEVPALRTMQIISPLKGGFSGAAPFLVHAIYENTQSFQVVKYGQSDLIDAEHQNYNDHIVNGPFMSLNVLHEKAHIPKLPKNNYSLIIYEFAGPSDKQPKTFEELFESMENPACLLGLVLNQVLWPGVISAPRETNHVTFREILYIDDATTKRILAEAEKVLPSITAASSIEIGSEKLPNPFELYPFTGNLKNDIAIGVPYGFSHGDLNARNILAYDAHAMRLNGEKGNIDQVSIPCIIDYAKTGKGLLYQDVAEIECAVKFQLTNLGELSLNELFAFESTEILNDIILPAVATGLNPHLEKMAACVSDLRASVAKYVGKYENTGYWLSLYKTTLIQLKYFNLTPLQKKYAILSAAEILRRHLEE